MKQKTAFVVPNAITVTTPEKEVFKIIIFVIIYIY